MNNNIDLLNICLEDSLFAALYEALCNLEDKWHTSSPVDMWIKALSARQNLSKSKRPDLLLRQLFVDSNPNEVVVVKAILMWILFNEDRSTEKTPLKDALARMLSEQSETWNVVYSEFRESESRNEQMGYDICQTDYSQNAVPTKVQCQKISQNSNLAHEMVSYAMESHNQQLCYALYYILSHIDYQRGHIYEDEVRRLANQTDEMEKASHEPRRVENRFYKDSCNFEPGSTLNGDVTITGPIYQGETKPKENAPNNPSDIVSPLHLSENASKIDLIRIMNAWYECGKVADANGAKPTKKEFFTWVGNLFNIDLANYDKDLSNSMSSSVALNKQIRIFDELKEKHESIYNSK